MNDEVDQIKERLDLVDVISSYLTLKKAGAHLKANCPFHNEKSPSFMVSAERQTFKCFGCFPAGQLIQTRKGFIEIQDIRKGDFVYTDKGRLRKVNLVFEREYVGDLLEITPKMIVSPVKITGDHNVFVIRTKNCKQVGRKSRICQKNCRQNCPTKYFQNYKIEKIHARELKVNDFLLYPIKQNLNQENKINLFEYTGVRIKSGPKPRDLKTVLIDIDQNFARLAGLYIAEGSSHRAYIRFSFGNHEEYLAREVCLLMDKIFGLKSSIHKRSGNRSGIEVTCCNSILGRAFEVLFGKGAENKKIPDFFIHSNNDILKSLLSGIFDGDGTTTKNQKKGIGGRKSITSISFILAHQLKDILIGMGQRPSITCKKPYFSKDKVNHKASYYINWRENDKTHFSDFIKIGGTDYWLLPIRKIVRSDYSGLVYNLNVDEDHSYLTQSFAVGNCGEGGDIFTFIEKIEGVDFYNALKILADKAGVKLKSNSIKYGDREYKSDKKTKIFEINDWTKKLYHKILIEHPKAKPARDYLNQRGMTEKMILEFEIGYAPLSWELLIKFLEKKGYAPEEAVQAGVAIRNDKGSIYDRFRGRIIFPINNIMGATIAFTSRILKEEDGAAKYINSSESPVYIKGKTIYGLDKAKMAIKETDLAVMVEGNMDVIACHQAGYKNVVATSGTAITLDQLKILNRYGGEIAFSFDSDAAGETAMKRAITMALQNDITTKIIALPAVFKDPDEAIKSDPKNWSRAVEKSRPALEYWIDLLIRKNPDLGVSTKKKIAKEILPVIKTIYSDIEKEYYIKYLSAKLVTSEKALISALSKTKEEAPTQKESAPALSAKFDIFEKMLGLLWHNPALSELIGQEFDEVNSEKLSKFIEMVKKKKIDRDKVPPNEAVILNQYEMIVAEDMESNDGDAIKAEFQFLLARTRSAKKDVLKSNFAQKIKEAEAKGDKEKLKSLLSEFSNLIK